jgi:hypothetical protein
MYALVSLGIVFVLTISRFFAPPTLKVNGKKEKEESDIM